MQAKAIKNLNIPQTLFNKILENVKLSNLMKIKLRKNNHLLKSYREFNTASYQVINNQKSSRKIKNFTHFAIF